MSLDYRTLSLPEPWPGGKRKQYPTKSPFGANWGGTTELLERQLRHLNAKDVTLAIGVTLNDIRKDGGVRADARIKDPAVVLSFKSGANVLTFPCDTFNFWQDNVRAIALALEALRKIDRYGVQQGKQYEGFKALPATTLPTMTTSSAADIVAGYGDFDPIEVETSPSIAKDAIRAAKNATHPDRENGGRDSWDAVQAAARVLSSHHGVSL